MKPGNSSTLVFMKRRVAMRKISLLLCIAGLISACGPPEPNPHAEEVLLAFAEAINNQDYETARTFVTPDATARVEGSTTPKTDMEYWISGAEFKSEYYEFSDFVITGNNVEFRWFYKVMGIEENCVGNATLKGEKIDSLLLTCSEFRGW
jgi:hypothetical protein